MNKRVSKIMSEMDINPNESKISEKIIQDSKNLYEDKIDAESFRSKKNQIFECEKCGNTFHKMDKLRRHRKRDIVYSCRICFKDVCTKFNRTKHEKICFPWAGTPQIKSQQCDK